MPGIITTLLQRCLTASGRRIAQTVGLVVLSLTFAWPAISTAAELRLATTYTLNDSGLLDALLPAFQRESGIRVKPIIAGTGQALRLAERGDADVVWSHSQTDEERFVSAGFGTERVVVMSNTFVLLGPRDDPAHIAGEGDAVAALRRIASAHARFVSRADESGTHKKEMALWQAAGIKPQGTWYIAAGVGMGQTLTIADERSAYVLADEATYAARKRQLDLIVVSSGDPRLVNIYAIIAVNPRKVAGINTETAGAFVRWVTAGNGRALIAGYRIRGEPVFRVANR